MSASPQLKALVDQLPNPDARGMFTGTKPGDPNRADQLKNIEIDKEKIDRVTAEIFRGGRESVLGVIEMLVPPGERGGAKAHYALHCLANHVLKIKDESARRMFAETLAGELGGRRPKALQAYLCQELQWAGRREAAPALGKLLTDEDLVEPATMALVAIRDGAAEQFRAAWPAAKGKCRLNVIHGLAAVGDPQAASVFKDGLNDPDREVRLAAGAGLAKLGDASAADLLLKAADGAAGWERIQATKHCLVLAERLAAAGQKDRAARIYRHIRDTRTGRSEKYLRDLADKALAKD